MMEKSYNFRDRVMELLRYEPETGKLFWRESRGGIKAGSETGPSSGDGYLRAKIDGRKYLAHRLAWIIVHGRWPAAEIDHIDGNRANNRLDNLREATMAENQQNKGAHSNNTSGFTGVWWREDRRKWRAEICANGKRKSLGCFATPEEAAEAYAAAKRKLHTFHPEVVSR